MHAQSLKQWNEKGRESEPVYLAYEILLATTTKLLIAKHHHKITEDQNNFQVPPTPRTPETVITVIDNDDTEHENDVHTTAIDAVKNVQSDKSAYNNPLWWGVLDFREDNISPCPDNPRAKEFLSEREVNHFMNALKGAIQEEKEQINKSVESFLEALLLFSDITSIRHLAKECGVNGFSGLCSFLKKSAEKMKDDNVDKEIILYHLKNIDIYDEATIYLVRCILETDVWISSFSGKCQSERTVDMFIVGPYAKTPCTIFLYGENRSDADREDKTERSGADRVGKSCDFLYWKSSRESGIGENSGPLHKDNHNKSITNFIEVIKVAKSQHKKLEKNIIEQCGIRSFPEIRKGIESIYIPCFQVIGMRIRFYLLFQISGDLYGIWDWASELLPTNDEDIGEMVLLCRAFLLHSAFVDRVGKMTNVLIRKAKALKFKSPKEFAPKFIKLNQLRTPQKKNNRKESVNEEE